jgi:hypothetical protein
MGAGRIRPRRKERVMDDFDGGEQQAPTRLSAETLRGLSHIDFARLGANAVAYVRPTVLNGAVAFAIHAADGTQIGAAPSLQLAAAAIRQHEMEPALVH